MYVLWSVTCTICLASISTNSYYYIAPNFCGSNIFVTCESQKFPCGNLMKSTWSHKTKNHEIILNHMTHNENFIPQKFVAIIVTEHVASHMGNGEDS